MTGPRGHVHVLDPGPLTTVQDQGRAGHAHLGVSTSGACDHRSYQLANRLVGNLQTAAALETTFGGLVIACDRGTWIAVTGASTTVHVGARRVDTDAPVFLPAGSRLTIGPPTRGLRNYVAVRGGLDTPLTLGSRSTDQLGGLGPPPARTGDVLPVGGDLAGDVSSVDHAPVPLLQQLPTLTCDPGPRLDWFGPDVITVLADQTWTVRTDSSRTAVQLAGSVLPRAGSDELPSEGLVPGAIQVPRSGQPLIFLADRPITGGYPVVAVLRAADLDLAGQLRPGQQVRFACH